jgi:hypothetical protein
MLVIAPRPSKQWISFWSSTQNSESISLLCHAPNTEAKYRTALKSNQKGKKN